MGEHRGGGLVEGRAVSRASKGAQVAEGGEEALRLGSSRHKSVAV